MRNRCAVALAALSFVFTLHGQGLPPMTYKDGLLSIRMENGSVLQALEELARLTRVKITVADNVDDSTMSVQSSSVSPEAALRWMLARYDTFFYYGGPSSDAGSLQAVWVFNKGSALAFQPVPPEKWAGTKEIEASINHTDPRVRQRAWEALMTRPDDRTRDLLIQAIRGSRERDEEVRQRIFSAALQSGLHIPAEVLSELARADSSEQIRWMALDAVAQDASAKQVAEAALTDASPSVRQKAEEILTALAAERQRRDIQDHPPDQQP